MKKKWILYSGLIVAMLTIASLVNQGCVGGVPPVTSMIAPPPSYTPYPSCTPTSTPALIDDMEDNNTQVLNNECRSGYWFAFHDTSAGVQTTTISSMTMSGPGVGYNGTGTSLHAVEVTTDNGFTIYGPGFGVNLTNPQGNYDARIFTGIQFYAKNTLGPLSVGFAVNDANVLATAYATGPYTKNILMKPPWKLWQISYADLIAAGNSYGTPTVFDTSKIQQIQWAIGTGLASDIWIDNLSFY